MKTHRIIITLLCCLPLQVCRSHSAEEQPPKPVVEVKLAKAEIADLVLAVHAPATIFPREQANIAARITARITKLNAAQRRPRGVGTGAGRAGKSRPHSAARRARAVITDAEANLQKTAAGTCPLTRTRARTSRDGPRRAQSSTKDLRPAQITL
jgi:hypothetical protein